MDGRESQNNSSIYLRYLIGKVRHYMFTIRQKELKAYHVSPQQVKVLYFLYSFGPGVTLTELARKVDRGINTVSIQMTRMEKDGLVKKIRETPKSNLLSFELTEKGLNTYENTKDMPSVEEIMSVLSEEERQQMISSLGKIISRIETYKIEPLAK